MPIEIRTEVRRIYIELQSSESGPSRRCRATHGSLVGQRREAGARPDKPSSRRGISDFNFRACGANSVRVGNCQRGPSLAGNRKPSRVPNKYYFDLKKGWECGIFARPWRESHPETGALLSSCMLLHNSEWSSRYFGNIRLSLQYGNPSGRARYSLCTDATHSLL